MLILIFLLSSLPTYAAHDFVYFTGESLGSEDTKVLKEEAYQNALRNLVLEHYGANVTVEDGSTDKVNYGRVFIDSPTVNLKGLTIQKSFVEPGRAVVVIKVSKDELARAKSIYLEKRQTLLKENDRVGYFLPKVTPIDSVITINGIPVKNESKVALPIGLKHRVSIKHRDYLTEEMELVLSEVGPLEKDIILKSIPSVVVVNRFPPDSSIYIDDVKQPKSKKRFFLEAGKHKFTVSKGGYFDSSYDVEVRANDSKAKVLSFDLKVRTLREREITFEYSPLWVGAGYQLVSLMNFGVKYRYRRGELGAGLSVMESGLGRKNDEYEFHDADNSIGDFRFNYNRYFLQTNTFQVGYGLVGGVIEIKRDMDPENKLGVSTWYIGPAVMFKAHITNDVYLHAEVGGIWGSFRNRNFSEKAIVGIGWNYK